MAPRFHRWLVVAGYLAAGLLVAIPPGEALIRSLPMSPGDVTWRFAALGQASQAVMTPLLGMALAAFLAAARGHGRILKGTAVAATLAAVFLVVGTGVFVLDAIQMRGPLEPDVAGEFDASATFAVAKMLLGTLTLLALAVGAWKSAEAADVRRGDRPTPGSRPRVAIRDRS